MLFAKKPLETPTAETALPGRAEAIATSAAHFVNGHALKGPIRQAWSWRSSPWAASGASSGCSGTFPASG